jgi:hypothetical protein
MHGFEFEGDGRCVATGYGTKPPATCKASAYAVLEQNGIVLAYHDHDGGTPSWQPPAVDMSGFGPLRTAVFEKLRTHPQETTENSVDIGHLGVVHGYRDVRTLSPLETNGPHLTTRYCMTRKSLVPHTKDIYAEFTIHVHGLGYSYVDVEVKSHRLRVRHFVLSTPTDGEYVDLHLAGCVKGEGSVLGRVPGWALDRHLGRALMNGFLSDTRQDLRIWTNKRYVHPPALAQGDGPVGKYRAWTRQFYPDAPPRATKLAMARS